MSTKLSLSYDFSAIDHAQLAPTTRAQYRKALANYLDAGGDLGDANYLAEYARSLSKSSRSFLKAAVRMVTQGFAQRAKASATPDNVNQVQAALYRLEAIQDAIHVESTKGERAHAWLSQKQVHEIMATCDDSLTGKRDWIVLGLLLGAGLRREELVALTFDDLIDLPMSNNGMRTCLQVHGKGAKDRVVPIKPVLAKRLQEWRSIVGSGLIARSLGRKVEIGESLSAVGLFGIVRKHGAMIGMSELDPHDCRRTFAQLGYEAGVPLTQISKQLGHSSVSVTQRYLNLDLNLVTTISDFIPLE